MTATAIVDIFCATFVGITLAGNTSGQKNGFRSNRRLNLCLLLMLLTLIDDAMSYTFVGVSYPLAFRYMITLFSFLATSVLSFAYTLYAEELFKEKGYTHSLGFRVLNTVELAWLLATAYAFISGRLVSYDAAGVENLNYSIPAYVTVFEIVVLVGLPILTVINRRRIGIRQTILMCLFNVVPIVAFLAFIFLKADFSYAFSAITLVLITAFAQKTHEKTLENEYGLQREREAESERIRKEQIAMMAGGVSAYIVDPKTERFQIISQSSYLAENYTSEEDFNTSFSRYIKNDVFEPDRKAVAEKINIPVIVKALENNDEYFVRYRDTSAGYPHWYEMRAVRLSEDEILYGFTDKEDEINGQMLYDKMLESYFGLYYIDLDSGLAQIIRTGHPELTGEAGKTVSYSDLIKNIFAGSEGDALVFLDRISDIEYLKRFFADKDLAYNVYKSYIFEGNKWVTVTGMVLSRHEDGTPSVFGLGFTLLDDEASEKEEAKLKVAQTMAFTNYLLEPYDSAYYINLSNLSWTAYRRPDIIEQNYPAGENYVESLGRYIVEEVHPDDREALAILVKPDKLKAVLSEKTQFEIRFRKISEQTEKYLDCFVIRGADEDQAAFGFLDVTAQVNEELKQRKAMQQQLDIIGGLAGEYTALYHVDLDTDDYISYHLIEKAEDIRPFYDRYSKFADLAHAFANSDLVRPEDRENIRGFYPSADVIKEHMKDRKIDSMLFKRNYGGKFLWTEITIVKCEDIGEEAHNIIVGFVEKDREVRERTERFKEADEIQKLIDNITSDFNIVYVVDMANDTYEIHRMDENMLESGRSFASFSEAISYTLENVIHPYDRERMRREFDFDTIRRNLASARSHSAEYRMVKNNNTIWGEMRVSYAGMNKIIFGMTEKDIETAKRLIEEKRFDENFALFEVDIDRGYIRVLKNTREYQVVPVGGSAPYTQYMLAFAAHFENEVAMFFREISDLDFIKSEFAKDDKRTYSFRSHHLERHQWVDMTSYVILRHEDGTPAMFTIAFSLADALATVRQELQTRMQEDMHMISGIASGYNALYYINIDKDLLHIYTLDETKYPGSKEIFEGAETDFYKIIGGYGLSEQVHPDDRHLFKDFGPEWIREKLADRKKYSMRFRAATDTGYRWDEMELTKYEDIGDQPNAVAVGFTDRDADIRREQAINNSFDVLGQELPPEEAVDCILSIVGEFYGAERSYVFEYAGNTGYIDNTYEWCAGGIEPMIGKLQHVPMDAVEGWNNEFKRQGAFYMDALDSEHNTEETVSILEMQGIESLVAAPLMNAGEIVGFIGVDNPSKAKKDISILEKASAVVYSEILKRSENDEEHVTLNKLTDAFLSVYYTDLNSDYMRTWKMDKDYREAYGNVANYSVAMGGYVRENIAERDRERCILMTSPEYIMEQFRTKDQFSVDMTDIMLGYERSVVFDYIKVNDDGTQFVICCRDVSDSLAREKDQQRLLENALETADAANRSKTDFLFSMSHDIRTPMNAIMGFTNMAIKHIDDKEKTVDCLKKTQKAGGMLLSLINSVLEVSRIESGHATLEEQPGDVYYSFANIENTMREMAETKDIELTFAFGDIRDRFVYADFSRCMRVFVNVISNAIKYTPNGGCVSVRCEQLGEAENGTGTYRYTVTDNGIGMSEEFQKHIFEQFAREQTSTVSGIQGSGLGMSVVKSFVELLGGNVSVKSRQGEGSEFTIILPFRLQDKQEYIDPESGELVSGTAKNSVTEMVDLNGRKVLLVEDNELNQEIATEILEEAGLIVECADDGTVAVEMMRENGPDCYDFILMDIQMPIMNGYEATEAIRAMYPDRHIPIIALSANAFAEDRKKSMKAGMDDHVAKPINISELFGTLAKYLL